VVRVLHHERRFPIGSADASGTPVIALVGMLLVGMSGCSSSTPGGPVDAGSYVTTLAGNGVAGFADGPPGTVEFHGPGRLVVEPSGVVVVADQDNNRIRSVASDGTTTTLAGSGMNG
jgi:hypothetical protein